MFRINLAILTGGKMLTAQQKKERLNYIGSTDIAGVLGMSQYKSPLSVWSEKTGQIIPEDISNKLQVKLGIKMESIVGELFTEETQKSIQRVNETIYHPKYKFLAVNLDRRVIGEKAILEIKTAGIFKKKDWIGENIPIDYILQVMFQLAVTGWPKAYLCVLFGNSDFEIRTIERDEKALADMIKKAVFFWQEFVEKRQMPMQITSNDEDVLGSLFPMAKEGSVIELGDDCNKIVESLDSLLADEKILKREIDEQKNTLRAMMKNSETAKTNNYRITWKNQIDHRINVEKMKADAPTIYEKYLVESNKRCLRYKKLTKEE